jgi:hypothetical protein
MSPTNDPDEIDIPTDQVEDDLDEEEEDEDQEADEEEEERPDDAVDCPQCDQWSADPDCSLCGGRRWVYREDLDAFLGDNRVPCLQCGGEGEEDGPGPVSWSCPICLGTGRMPVAELPQFTLANEDLSNQDWSKVDLSGSSLSGATFTNCSFRDVNFAGADLSGARFEDCQFRGANPELAASLEGTILMVDGLSEEQVAICVARGATTEEPDEVGDDVE